MPIVIETIMLRIQVALAIFKVPLHFRKLYFDVRSVTYLSLKVLAAQNLALSGTVVLCFIDNGRLSFSL